MATVLSNAVFSNKVTAQASDDKYNYYVNYEMTDSNKTLVSISINVQDKKGNYIGNMNYNQSNNTKSLSSPCNNDTSDIVPMIDAIINEVKSLIVVA